ncbi:hypothetical protein HID58_059715 [Brassica napus]|uniref:Uncharacterized protein n=1 Tax=Brassica napus TaxID=3708 RepID=A0ABQ7ZTP2_BRANA|nr:hypothetical protein HID58_059715 [Brassica napus]
MIRYDKCIKDCDKAVERDRKHMSGKEQLCGRWKKTAGFVGYATAPYTLSSDAPVLSSELRPKHWRARVESETEGLDWWKPIEEYVETWLESTEMERMVRYLATKRSKSGLRMASPFC